MPIAALLKSQAFDPEELRLLGEAFDAACQSLGFPAGERATIVAALIIEQARSGERDPDRLCAAAVKAYRRQVLGVA
jgi:hypothetical protein